MGIFTRLFQRGADGAREADASEPTAPEDETPEPTEREHEPAPVTPGLAAAAAGASHATFALPVWPKRPERPEREAVMSEPKPRSRAPLPGLPKRADPLPAEDKGVKVTFTKPAEKNDATMVMSPPPPGSTSVTARPLTPAPRSTPPAPPQPAARRTKPDTIDSALDEVVMEILEDAQAAAVPAEAHGVSTPEDLHAVRNLFNDVAVSHVAQVRDVMLELRYGQADPRWIEMTKPALQSLRAMAKQMELTELCQALDEFCAAVEGAVANRAGIGEDDKVELLRRYQRLIELIPQTFELDAERDRREPIIVEALLSQIEGVERPTIDKLFAVGLNRLDALINANAGDVAAVSGLRPELAAAIVEQFQSYRSSASATVSAPDPHSERRQIADLLIMLSLQNDDFTRVSTEWSDEARARKRALRKEREHTFQQIKVARARLGERDQLAELEKQPFHERIATIDRYLSSQQPARPV
jgi:hypothetical protein